MSPGNEPWANNFLSFPFFCTVSCLEDGMRSHRLLQFPVASVSNYHQRGGLKQHRLTLLLFWRSEVSHSLPGLKSHRAPSRGPRRESVLVFSRFRRTPTLFGSCRLRKGPVTKGRSSSWGITLTLLCSHTSLASFPSFPLS